MMAMDTDRLIQTLAETAQPVRRLPRPSARTAMWLAIAAPYVALVIIVMSPRADLAAKLTEARFLIEQFGALATGVAAAVAAFATTIPGYNRKVLLLPLLPLVLWLGVLGQGCVSSLIQFGLNGLSLQPDWICLPAIVLVGAVPAIAMAVMLRRGAPLFPHVSTALGALASAGLGNFGLRFFHPQDASLMVLVWQFGTVFALTCLAGFAGHYLLSWSSIIAAVRRRAAIS
jgi:hypothetical protein